MPELQRKFNKTAVEFRAGVDDYIRLFYTYVII